MGTNYEAQYNICPCCEKPETVVHIGKSSFGWPFCFRAYPPPYSDCDQPFVKKFITDINDWREVLSDPKVVIVDEYGRVESKDDFWEGVEVKKKKGMPPREEKYYGNLARYDRDSGEYFDEQGYRFSSREFS